MGLLRFEEGFRCRVKFRLCCMRNGPFEGSFAFMESVFMKTDGVF